MKKIFLYGPPGSGKSTAGKLLAEGLGVDFLDLDPLIEQRAGTRIPRIMAEQGEPAFREREAAALKEAVSDGAGVIALGGGALLRLENRALAEASGQVVCLEAGAKTLMARLGGDPVARPLLAGDMAAKLTSLLENRRAHYLSFPDRIETDLLTPEQVAWQIQLTVGRFCVRGMGRPYDVIVEPGGLQPPERHADGTSPSGMIKPSAQAATQPSGEEAAPSAGLDGLGARLRERKLGGPVTVVADSRVRRLYARRAVEALSRAGYQAKVLSFPAGEASKTLDTVSTLWAGFLEAGMDRRSTVVALGGGVTSDLAGFAAATFMRGIAWAAVPTSLLAMADACLGGKTGVDLPQGKNLVGAFHPPSLVLADPDLLATLPDAELRAGLAEVLKHGLLGDASLFGLCAGGFEGVKRDLPKVIRQAMGVKIAVIQVDPYEGGLRASLNLGHTVGHAVEIVSGYRVCHGDAVAIGMVAEARLAERLGKASPGLSGQIVSALAGLGLPTEIPVGLRRQDLIRAMKLDKKKSSGIVRFALPISIGKVESSVAVENLELLFDI